MRWSYSNNSPEGLVCINPYKGVYIANFTPNNKNINAYMEDCNYRYVSVRIEHNPSLLELKSILIELQKEYDNSDEVNRFNIGNEYTWIPKADRVGLVNSINVAKRNEDDTIELWFDNKPLVVDIDYAGIFLDALELYAMECYKINAKHIAEINALTTIQEVLSYDITKDYKDYVTFNTDFIIND